MHVRTNIWTHEHARGLTDRQSGGMTDGRTQTYASSTRACKHTNACIDERTHVRSNIWTHEHARGQTQTDERTDGRIQTYALTHACMQTRTHEFLNACLYDQTYGRTNMHADRQIDRQTDGRTPHSHICPRASTHTNASMLTRTHDALRYIRTHVRTEANTQVQT